MLAAQTNSTAFIAAKLTAKTIITRIFFVLTFTHYFSSRIIVLQCKNFFSPFPAPRFHEDKFREDLFHEDKF